MGRYCVNTHDEDFFNRDTPESFYWAGFIAADGCVCEKKNSTNITLSINLATKDENHLQKLKNAIKYTGKIYRTQEVGSWKFKKLKKPMYFQSKLIITITNSLTINGLNRFNIFPRKSLVYEFPEWLKNHLLVNHFIRGYFDGDGSVMIEKAKLLVRVTPKLRVCFLGTKDFLKACHEIFIKNCQVIEKKKIPARKDCKIHVLQYVGNRVSMRIANFLYKDSTEKIFLNRKHDIFYDGFFDTLPDIIIKNLIPLIATNTTPGDVIKFASSRSKRK